MNLRKNCPLIPCNYRNQLNFRVKSFQVARGRRAERGRAPRPLREARLLRLGDLLAGVPARAAARGAGGEEGGGGARRRLRQGARHEEGRRTFNRIKVDIRPDFACCVIKCWLVLF